MVFGELLPQFLGISAPLATAKVVAMPVRIFAIIAKPLIVVLNGSANLALRAMGITPQEELRRAHPAGARVARPPLGRGRHPRHAPPGS